VFLKVYDKMLSTYLVVIHYVFSKNILLTSSSIII